MSVLRKNSPTIARLSGKKVNGFLGITRLFAQAAQGDNDTQTIINIAATAELFATTHYLAAINGDLGLDQTQIDYLKTGFLAEQDHLDLLRSLGAEPVVTEFYVPENLFSDQALFAATTEVAETTFVAAYLAATRAFTAAGATPFAVTAAQIAAVEAEHRALARQIGGLTPNHIPYAMYQFDNVSDAVPVLQAFLDGSGEGFIGPVQPPTEDDIAAIRAEAEALGYVMSQPFAAMDMASGSTSSAGACMVMARSQNVNIRSDASTSSSVMGTLSAGQAVEVIGQRSVGGFTWWQLSSGGFVRGDTVSATDACTALPSV
jgi:rubrerythrin